MIDRIRFDLYLWVAAFCSILSGTLTPVFSFLFGRMTNSFTGGDIQSKVNENALYLFYLSVAAFLLTSMERYSVSRSTNRRSLELRIRVLDRSLSQPYEWHQNESSPDIISLMVLKLIPAISDGLGAQLSAFLRSTVTTSLGLAVSFFADPYLTGLILACVMPSLLCINLLMRMTSKKLLKERDVTEKAGNAITRSALVQVRVFAAELRHAP
jgi:ABC-type multidrug transport system fused ATPase/permease subunit